MSNKFTPSTIVLNNVQGKFRGCYCYFDITNIPYSFEIDVDELEKIFPGVKNYKNITLQSSNYRSYLNSDKDHMPPAVEFSVQTIRDSVRGYKRTVKVGPTTFSNSDRTYPLSFGAELWFEKHYKVGDSVLILRESEENKSQNNEGQMSAAAGTKRQIVSIEKNSNGFCRVQYSGDIPLDGIKHPSNLTKTHYWDYKNTSEALLKAAEIMEEYDKSFDKKASPIVVGGTSTKPHKQKWNAYTPYKPLKPISERPTPREALLDKK